MFTWNWRNELLRFIKPFSVYIYIYTELCTFEILSFKTVFVYTSVFRISVKDIEVLRILYLKSKDWKFLIVIQII